jgi:hypothetical protein
VKSNIDVAQNTTRERLARLGEQTILILLINISHYTVMEGEEEEDPGFYTMFGR